MDRLWSGILSSGRDGGDENISGPFITPASGAAAPAAPAATTFPATFSTHLAPAATIIVARATTAVPATRSTCAATASSTVTDVAPTKPSWDLCKGRCFHAAQQRQLWHADCQRPGVREHGRVTEALQHDGNRDFGGHALCAAVLLLPWLLRSALLQQRGEQLGRVYPIRTVPLPAVTAVTTVASVTAPSSVAAIGPCPACVVSIGLGHAAPYVWVPMAVK